MVWSTRQRLAEADYGQPTRERAKHEVVVEQFLDLTESSCVIDPDGDAGPAAGRGQRTPPPRR